MRLDGLQVKIFADGADLRTMRTLAANPRVKGFTTNPSLARRAGVRNYRAFVRGAVTLIPDKPISFEVLADELPEMARQARGLADCGENVFVKIPISTTRGESTLPLVHDLLGDGVPVNVTAVLTPRQIDAAAEILGAGEEPCFLSVFAGRIADTGRDPLPFIAQAVAALKGNPRAEVIWASPREPFNIIQADAIGCQVITVFPEMLQKFHSTYGRDLAEYSLDTVKMFFEDARQAGFAL